MPGIDARAPERTDTSSGLAGSPKRLPTTLLDLTQVAVDLRRASDGGVAAAVRVEVRADLGGDREAGRDGQPEAGHLGEVGALAAEQLLHRGIAVGDAAAEGKDELARAALGGHRACCWPPRRAHRLPTCPSSHETPTSFCAAALISDTVARHAVSGAGLGGSPPPPDTACRVPTPRTCVSGIGYRVHGAASARSARPPADRSAGGSAPCCHGRAV